MPVSVRYIVNDVDAAIAFYTEALGFKLDMHPAPGFAALSRGELRMLLNKPGAGARARRRLTEKAPHPAAGTGFRSRCRISPARSRR